MPKTAVFSIETVTEKTTLKFTTGMPYKINDNGEFVRTNI